MLGKTILVALVGALAVSANEVHSLVARSLLTRQISPSQIPSACQSQCTSALTIYQACTSGDTATCISVCGASNYSNFVGCLQCVLNNTPGVSTAEVSALNTIVGQLAGACQQAGSPVSSTSFVVSATGSRSGSASGSSTGLIGGSGVAGSAISSITRSGSATQSGGGLGSSTGAVASLTSALSSVAASASSSRAAGQAQAILPQGIQAAFLGIAGIAGGAALVL